MESAVYQQLILDYHRQPVGFVSPTERTFAAFQQWEKKNLSCGDEVILYLVTDLAHEDLLQFKFSGESCAICRASCSLMMKQVNGKTQSEILAMTQRVLKAFQEGKMSDVEDDHLQMFISGMKRFPGRLSCGLLPWQTLDESLRNTPIAGENP